MELRRTCLGQREDESSGSLKCAVGDPADPRVLSGSLCQNEFHNNSEASLPLFILVGIFQRRPDVCVCDEVTALMTNVMRACIFLCFLQFPKVNYLDSSIIFLSYL